MKKKGSSADKTHRGKEEIDDMEVDDENPRPRKVLRMEAKPRVTEIFAALWNASNTANSSSQ
jgi:hypothetical protein